MPTPPPRIMLAIAGCLAAASTHAAEPTTTSPVIVTATRTAQTADQTLAAVTVIDRDDIERLNARSVTEVLRRVPGVDYGRSGGYGKESSLFLRGTESDHVLVLIDGMRLGSATAGKAAFESLPLDQIERIEIVRGPRSALYGSEAIGGVIQIFTRGGGEGRNLNASAGYGSHDTYRLSAGIDGSLPATDDRTRYRLQLSRFDTDGFDATTAATEPDDDGYDNTALSATLEHRFSDRAQADARLLHARGTSGFDGSFQNESDFVQQVLSAGVNVTPANAWDMRLSVGETRDELESFLNGTSVSVFDTRRWQAGWQNDLYIGETDLLTLGIDYYEDEVDSTSAFTVDSRYNAAAYAQWQTGIGRHDVLLGVRHDDNEAFGGNTTGSLEWGYGFANGLRLTAAYGTAFKAPSFNELYFPGFGNPNLDPEQSTTWELGLSGGTPWAQTDLLNWELRAYRTEVDDLIETVETVPGSFIFEPRNVAEAEIEGVEAVVDTRLAGWDLQASAAVLDPRNEATGKRLRRRSPRTLRLDADRDLGRWRLGLGWLVQDGRYEDAANLNRLAGYGILDLRAGYPVAQDWDLKLEIDNALDRDYQTVAGFNSLGRTVMLNLAYRPGR